MWVCVCVDPKTCLSSSKFKFMKWVISRACLVLTKLVRLDGNEEVLPGVKCEDVTSTLKFQTLSINN